MKLHIFCWILSTLVVVAQAPSEPLEIFDENNSGPIKPGEVPDKYRLPASQCAECTWGTIAESGIQVALRFSKKTFFVGEEIFADVVIRNTSTNIINLDPGFIIKLTVTKDGIPMRFIYAPGIETAILNTHEQTLFPRMQRGYTQNVTKQYDISQPGEYVISANFPLHVNKMNTVYAALKNGQHIPVPLADMWDERSLTSENVIIMVKQQPETTEQGPTNITSGQLPANNGPHNMVGLQARANPPTHQAINQSNLSNVITSKSGTVSVEVPHVSEPGSSAEAKHSIAQAFSAFSAKEIVAGATALLMLLGIIFLFRRGK